MNLLNLFMRALINENQLHTIDTPNNSWKQDNTKEKKSVAFVWRRLFFRLSFLASVHFISAQNDALKLKILFISRDRKKLCRKKQWKKSFTSIDYRASPKKNQHRRNDDNEKT